MKSDEKRVQALKAESTIAVQGRKHPKTPGSKLLSLKRSKKTHRQRHTLCVSVSEEEEAVVKLRVYRLKTQTETYNSERRKDPVLHTHDPKSIQARARGCATAPQKRDLPECQTSTLPGLKGPSLLFPFP